MSQQIVASSAARQLWWSIVDVVVNKAFLHVVAFEQVAKETCETANAMNFFKSHSAHAPLWRLVML